MLRKSFVIFGLALVDLACGSAPKVSPCFVRTDSGGCFYAPLGGDDVLLRPFDKTPLGMDKNICFTPEEHEAIITWIKRHGGKIATQNVVYYEKNVSKLTEKINGRN